MRFTFVSERFVAAEISEKVAVEPTGIASTVCVVRDVAIPTERLDLRILKRMRAFREV